MQINDALVAKALLLLHGGNFRVTPYNREGCLLALDHTIKLLQQTRARIACLIEPAEQVESEAGHMSDAEQASCSSPARSLPNSEEGASTCAPGTASQATPLSSLPNGDGVGHSSSAADTARHIAPAPSPTEHHSGAGLVRHAEPATPRTPVPAVVPTAAQKAARIQANAIVMRDIRDTFTVGGEAIGDVLWARAESVVRTLSEKAVKPGFEAAVMYTLHKRLKGSVIPAPGMRLRDVASAQDVADAIRDVQGSARHVARIVGRAVRTLALKAPEAAE